MGGRALVLAAAVLSIMALVGCGGGGDTTTIIQTSGTPTTSSTESSTTSANPEDDVNAAIEAARQAAISGDAAGFCGYLSQSVIDELAANDDINDVVPTCEKLVDANASSVKEIAGPEPTITSVTVNGDKATVTGELAGSGQRRFVTLGQPITIALVQEGGQWKLASLPPVSG